MPATDDMRHLQTVGADAEFFQRFDQDGHYGHGKGPYGTEQGYYAVTPSGKLLASTNKRDPALIAGLLKGALEQYAKLSKEERLMPEKQLALPRDTDRSDSDLYPKGGLVLLEYVKDLPEPGAEASSVTGNWNLDYVWISAAEAAALVPRKDVVGAKRSWDRIITNRLARFHFIDTVNGLRYSQRPMFSDEEVKDVALASEVEGVEGAQVKLRITGRALSRAETPWKRGIQLALLGHATWDREKKKFTAFKLAALGRRWGGTGKGKSFDRKGEKGAMPIGFTFALAGDSDAEKVPPMYVEAYGW